MTKKILLLILFCAFGIYAFTSQKSPDQSVNKRVQPTRRKKTESLARPERTEKREKSQFKKANTDQPKDLSQKMNSKKDIPDFFERDEHPYNEDGDLLMTQVLVLEDYAVAHGDILIGTYDEMLELEKKGKLPKLSEPDIWEGGIVPYTIDNDYPYPQRVKKVIEYYHQNTPIRFVEWDGASENYVIFSSGVEHCFAHLGRRGGPQKVVLSSGCYEAEIAHEIMHVLGFLHEQNREDRDEYLKIHWENIEEIYHEQFKKMPNPFTAGIKLPFDLNSIMIYSPFSFAIDTNRPTMTKKNGELYERSDELLSAGDIEKIELLYKGQ